MILAIRTDKPESELYLFNGGRVVAETKWPAHRELADTLLQKIETLLKAANTQLADVSGIVVFTGEGSFTGLRIGTTVANTIAYSNNIPIVASTGNDWIENGLKIIKSAKTGELITPQYHSEPNITRPAFRVGRLKKLELDDSAK